MQEIARDVALVSMPMSNAYLVGNATNWVLVDTGIPGSTKTIREAAEARFGLSSKPRAIILTHGHGDHAGSAAELADLWNVRVYSHKMGLPYITGKSPFPEKDITAPGAFSFLMRFFPFLAVNLGSRVEAWDGDFSLFQIPGWRTIETPGHAPGHISFFREEDRVLLVGDAFVTMNTDSLTDMITRRPVLSRTLPAVTYDWQQAITSVHKLAGLKPSLVATGHGAPMQLVPNELKTFAENLRVPSHGRYVRQPAVVDENGVVSLPPKPPDRFVRATVGVSAALLAIGFASLLIHKPKKSSSGT